MSSTTTGRSALLRVSAALLTATLLAAAFTLGSLAVPSVPDRPAPDAPLPAREWPMFGGTPQRNLANLFEKNLPFTWEVGKGKRKNIKWAADLGSKAFGGPVISGGRIFVGTNNENPRDKALGPVDLGVIMCFRESDGKFLWQAVHHKLPGGQVVDWPRQGIVSSPAVEGNRLYYVSNRCEVICANVADGKAIWTLDMIKELGVFPHNMSACSPLIVDDLIMVVTANGVNEDHLTIPAPQAPSFIAVNKKTGKVVWQNNSPTEKVVGVKPNLVLFNALVNRGELLMHGQWSNPAFDVVNGVPQVVFPGGDGWIYSFDLHGKLIWKFDCNPKDAVWAVSSRGTRSDFIGTPVIHKNRVYIGVGQDPEHRSGVGHFWCIDMTKKGDVSPELRQGNNLVIKNSNSAAVWHHGGAIVDPKERARLQRNHYFGRTMSTCAIHDGLVYIADIEGWLYCLDAETGKVQWTYDTEGDTWSSPFYADGKVYLANDAKSMFVFQHGRAKKLLAENEIDSRVRVTPVAHGGVLYMQTENRLYAIAHDR